MPEVSNTSTISNSSFVKQHKMDNVMKIYEKYLENESDISEDEIDFELSFDHHNCGDLLRRNISSSNPRREPATSLLCDKVDFVPREISEMLHNCQKEGGDFRKEITKTLMEINNPEQGHAFLKKLITEVKSSEEECLKEIAQCTQSKLANMLAQIKQSIQVCEERFQRKASRIKTNSAKPDNDNYFNHVSALLNMLQNAQCQKGEAIQKLEAIKNFCKNVKDI